MSRLSLAEQIAQLEAPTPVDFDPEDVLISGANPEEDDGVKKDILAAREHYLDVGPSTIRKHDSIADPKYEGVRTTRRSLAEYSDDGSAENEGSEEANEEDQSSQSEVPSQSEGEIQDDEEAQGQLEGAEELTSPRSTSKQKTSVEEEGDDMPTALRQKRKEDKRKGNAVVRQIAIWDALLEARIRLQKAATAVNRLPKPSDIEAYTQHPQCQEALNRMLEEAMLLSDALSDLQEFLLLKNENVSLPPRKRRKIDDNPTGVDYSKQLEAASEDAVAFEHAIHAWLVQTLNKWSAKIQAVSPSVLLPSNRNAFSKGSQQVKSVVQLVEETLQGHDKLLVRTRIRRGKERRITDTEQEIALDKSGIEEDPELFDDTDFYQQLLRDIIDSRGSGVEVGDWVAVQKEKKAKKKVDTRASKGRKVRYQVHEKLQNFMVSVPVTGAWHEEQIDELFASLLGKGYENGVSGEMGDIPLQNGNNSMVELESQLNGALMSGFKVFG